MSLDKKLEGLRESIRKMILDNVPVQAVWAICKQVDWESKTMVAIGTGDQLEYHDVLLGLDVLYKKPKSGTKCLLGIIENNGAQAFLITCDELDELLFQTSDADLKLQISGDSWVWNDGENKGLVILPAAVQRLNLIEQSINDLKGIIAGWTPVPNDGGAALKSAATSWAADPLVETQEGDIENEKIKH